MKLARLSSLLQRGAKNAATRKHKSSGKKKLPGQISLHGARNSRHEQPLHLFREMAKHGRKPRQQAVASVVSMCARNGQWELALETFQGMLKADYKEEIDTASYNAGIEAYASVGMWQQTLRLHEEMRDRNINLDETSIALAMNACSKAGEWEVALRLLDRMPRNGLPLSSLAYCAAMDACSCNGQWELALQLFEAMLDSGVNVDTEEYKAALRTCARNARADEAMNLYKNMRDARMQVLDGEVLNYMLDALRNEPDRAFGMWIHGLKRGVFSKCEQGGGKYPVLRVDQLSAGAAETAVRWWVPFKGKNYKRKNRPNHLTIYCGINWMEHSLLLEACVKQTLDKLGREIMNTPVSHGDTNKIFVLTPWQPAPLSEEELWMKTSEKEMNIVL